MSILSILSPCFLNAPSGPLDGATVTDTPALRPEETMQAGKELEQNGEGEQSEGIISTLLNMITKLFPKVKRCPCSICDGAVMPLQCVYGAVMLCDGRSHEPE